MIVKGGDKVNSTKFLTELKRPNVYRAAVAYRVVAWFLTQLTTQVFPFFEIPNSAVRFVVIALAVGFPIAMLLSWVYEFTPEGVVPTADRPLPHRPSMAGHLPFAEASGCGWRKRHFFSACVRGGGGWVSD